MSSDIDKCMKALVAQLKQGLNSTVRYNSNIISMYRSRGELTFRRDLIPIKHKMFEVLQVTGVPKLRFQVDRMYWTIESEDLLDWGVRTNVLDNSKGYDLTKILKLFKEDVKPLYRLQCTSRTNTCFKFSVTESTDDLLIPFTDGMKLIRHGRYARMFELTLPINDLIAWAEKKYIIKGMNVDGVETEIISTELWDCKN